MDSYRFYKTYQKMKSFKNFKVYLTNRKNTTFSDQNVFSQKFQNNYRLKTFFILNQFFPAFLAIPHFLWRSALKNLFFRINFFCPKLSFPRDFSQFSYVKNYVQVCKLNFEVILLFLLIFEGFISQKAGKVWRLNRQLALKLCLKWFF